MKSCAFVVLVVGLVTFARAEDADPNRAQFLSDCSGCHGVDAKGNGPLSSTLKSKPPDLTILAKRNGGVFPVRSLYQAIDGRGIYTGHDVREMPVWGCRQSPPPTISSPPSSPFSLTKRKKVRTDSVKSHDYQDHLNLSCDAEDVIANRILSVVEFLRRIQEK
jgi:hypothetical protein